MTPEQIASKLLLLLSLPSYNSNLCRIEFVKAITSAIQAAEERGRQSEREQAALQHGTCSVCGYIAWKRDGCDPDKEDCQYCALRDEARKVIEMFYERHDPRRFEEAAEAWLAAHPATGGSA